MPLPTGHQYNEAVQNPQVSFADIELKSAKVETDFLGLPKPYSGGFTLTFKLQNNSNSWAVRCMIRDVSELQQRYQAISDFFALKTSRYFIDAKYLQNGIRVNGAFYPVIKMKWMEGEPISIYLSKHYNNKSKVEAILNDFQNLVNELEVLGIAHGDLQQGNIIVKNDRLYLIDYDGMYLPALNGFQSNEVGHPNFQHPQRSAKDFNAKIDRFSSIVIYLSFKALIYKPSLWNKYHNSENLLLKSQDIGDLSKSALIADLNSISEIKALVERFVGVCHLDFERIPSLRDFINGNFIYDKSNKEKIAVKSSQYEVLDARSKATLLEHYGERVEVVGFISDYYSGRTYNGSQCFFLNVGQYPRQTFTITIWSEGISALKDAGKSPVSLTKKWVSVIGVLTSYQGRPQIVAETASQIQILASESEANERLKLRSSTQPKTSQFSRQRSTIVDKILEKKKVQDKEAQVFGELYKNIPASKPSTPITTSKSQQPSQTYKSQTGQTNTSQTSNKSTSSTGKSDNSGCTVAFIVAIIGAIIAGSASDGKLWFLGFVIGGIVGFWISDAFKS